MIADKLIGGGAVVAWGVWGGLLGVQAVAHMAMMAQTWADAIGRALTW